MPVKDEVWIIEDENILSVDDAKVGRLRVQSAPRVAPATAGRRPSPVGEPSVYAARAAVGSGSPKPLVSAALSFLLCGAGQAFNGQMKMGLLYLLVEAAVVTFHWSATAMWGLLREMADLFGYTAQQMTMVVAGLDCFLVLFILANVAQAWHYASVRSGRFHGFGRPIVSGLASGLLPGSGQLCNGQIGKAMAFFTCILSGALVALSFRIEPFAGYYHEIRLLERLDPQATQITAAISLVAAGFWAFSVYDALMVARYRGKA
jgi:TM2 domain-containing membrane protein YozV